MDFRGDQMALLDRMGITDELRANATGMGDQLIVDGAGRAVSRVPSVIFSGELEIERGDLSRVLHKHTADRVEYVFGDRIVAVDDRADGVDVTFERSGPRRFDLVVGADGQHSGVRRLVLGDERAHRTDLGYYAVGFTVPNDYGLDHSARIHNAPGRYVNVGSARDLRRASVNMVFAAADLTYDRRDPAQQREIVRQHFAGSGWVVPQLLDAMQDADDLYFTSLSQIHLERWSRGRSSCSATPPGAVGPAATALGTRCSGRTCWPGSWRRPARTMPAAFARYEELMRPATTKSQKFGPAPVGTWRRRPRARSGSAIGCTGCCPPD